MVKFVRIILLIILLSANQVLMFPLETGTRFDRIVGRHGNYSKTTVLSIIQGSRGLIWLGTYSGLLCYDGYTFTKYQYNPKNAASLASNIVHVVYEDKDNNIWVGTEGGGLNRFNRSTKDFTRFPHRNGTNSAPPLETKLVSTIYEDKNGKMWIGTDGGGLYLLDPETGKWSHFDSEVQKNVSLSNSRITFFHEDRNGFFWIGTEGGGVHKYDPKSGVCVNYRHRPSDLDSLSHDRVYAILEDQQGNFWIGTKIALDKLDQKENRFIHYKLNTFRTNGVEDSYRVQSLFQDSTGSIWVGTKNGLNLLTDPVKGTFTQYLHRINDPYSLGDDFILDIMEDRAGSIWIGTYSGGVNRLDRQKQLFRHVFKFHNTVNSLSGNYIVAICEDKEGILWIGTLNGLNRYDPKTNKFTAYTQGNTPQNISSKDVIAITEDDEGIIWIGTWDGGVNCFNRETGTFKVYKSIPGSQKGPTSDYILSLYKDRQGVIWIGTYTGGLNRFDAEKELFIQYQNEPGNSSSLCSNDVTTIFQDLENDDLLWVGTQIGGLDCLNRKTGVFKHFPKEPEYPKKSNSLNHNFVQFVYISPSNPEIVWVTTYGGGLNKYNKRTNQWFSYTQEEGLPSNSLYGILEDEQGCFWISSNNGIARFDPKSGACKNYHAADGLQDNEFNQGAFYKSKDGQFYFGGVNGFNTFLPEDITSNTFIPPIIITSFKYFSEDASHEEAFPEFDEVTLSYKDSFTFRFAALNYNASGRNQYAYKVEGQDDEWIPLGTSREITQRLNPGHYTFKVKGSNNDGIWNKEGVSIKIIVTPPYWETGWFRFLVVCMIGMFIFLLYRLRVRQYKAQQRRLEIQVAKRTREIREQKEIIEEKNNELEISYDDLKRSEENLRQVNATKDKFFSIISHDLRNPITALLGNSELLKDTFEMLNEERKQKYIKAISRSANNLYDLVENLLHWAKSQTKGLKCTPEKINLKGLSENTLSLLEMSAKKKKIELTSDVEKNMIAYADRNMVKTVLRNLVSNAVKFTGSGGHVRVMAEEKGDFIEIVVIDNGIGIDPDDAQKLFEIGTHFTTPGTAKEKGTGLGLILCKEFIEINHGKIWFENAAINDDGTATGSIFKFTLPRMKEKN